MIWHAAVSTASILAGFVSTGLAKNVNEYSDQLLRRMEARTQKVEAEKALAEAQEAANQAARSKRNRTIQKLDEEKQRVEVDPDNLQDIMNLPAPDPEDDEPDDEGS